MANYTLALTGDQVNEVLKEVHNNIVVKKTAQTFTEAEKRQIRENIGVGSGTGSGTTDHNQLTNRDAVNQHPMSAITGLQSALDAKGTYTKPLSGIPASDLKDDVLPTEYSSNELQKIWDEVMT